MADFLPPASVRPVKTVVLVILDGYGERAESSNNAVKLAHKPILDELWNDYPHGFIATSGPDVGLPPGQMGNSEVGHFNFGAGRVAMMELSRVDNAIADGTLKTNPVIAQVTEYARKSGGRLHLMGLVSNGGVHSSIAHLLALIDIARTAGVEVVVHAFLDGRDTQPGTAIEFIKTLEESLRGAGTIGTVSGRYWAMDRDNRWERIEKAFRAIARGDAPRYPTADAGIEASYAIGKTDEFVEPFVVGNYAGVAPDAHDSALHFNFRPDRARELTRALALADFHQFERGTLPIYGEFASMALFDASFHLPIAFEKTRYENIFPEVLAAAGLRQFRCAETEKYAHVTYFFNGGIEKAFAGEDRKMIPSPKDVSTYDKKPEMSAFAVADIVAEAIRNNVYAFVLVNFANCDMVGHTGVLPAAISAVEAVDVAVGRVVAAAREVGAATIITADHGNCELMRDPKSGEPHTSHTTDPVPLYYVNDRDTRAQIRAGGRISDVAPTMLMLLGLPIPEEMTGVSLLEWPR